MRSLHEASLQQEQNLFPLLNTNEDTTITNYSSTEEINRIADQTDITGRKNWKLMNGETEAVWPPKLYAKSIIRSNGRR